MKVALPGQDCRNARLGTLCCTLCCTLARMTSARLTLSSHLHVHFALLDYVAAFCAGTAILLQPHSAANLLFFPNLHPNDTVVFTLQLFAFMLIVFSGHFAYHIHYSIMTRDKIVAILWLLFVGDLLHLFVYWRGVDSGIFPGGLMNPGVLPNVLISSYAAVSRLLYLFLVPHHGLTAIGKGD